MQVNPDLSAHDIVQLVFERTLDSLHHAEHATDAVAGQNHQNRAIALLGSLQSSLDLERGGALARNLDELYSYMLKRLAQTDCGATREALREVRDLVDTLKEAWQAIQPSMSEENVA